MTRTKSEINAPAEPEAFKPNTRGSALEVAANGNAAPAFQSLAVAEFEGEPRIRDLDLAERLGFDRPRDIRKLIERHMPEINGLGICATVAQNHGGGRGRPSKEFYLNEEQALLVAVLSDAPQAPAVRAMLIRTFVTYRRGQLETPATLTDTESRKVIGGIVKAVVHKEIAEAIPSLVDRLVEERLQIDPRIAALAYVSANEILDQEWRVPSKGRRSIQRKVLNRLKDHCATGAMQGTKAAYSGTWIFPRAEAIAFVKANCGEMILDHTDKIGRQGVFKLIRP
jgi:hypothetical protein